MSATSINGRGNGSSNKFTTAQLAKLANGPAIYLAESVDVTTQNSMSASPEGYLHTVNFPSSLPGSYENYVVLLTPMNASSVYVAEMIDDSNGNFKGFSFFVINESTVMYTVIDRGIRPNV